MFVLSILKHTVKIEPSALGRDFTEVLVERLNRQFANYVIPNVGLCITFYDFKKYGASYIMPGDASTHTPVVFRYVVFQPMINEIFEGVILRSNQEGITISMQFFSDITVAPDKLPVVSKFDETVQIWRWEYQNENGDVTPFYMDPGKCVRFKVISVRYQNVEPGASPEATKAMTIEASMFDMGLGCVAWWEPQCASELKQEANDPNEDY
uniref:DNA-directed RNA polymerase III subunit RPC8 n=1 Tax=Globodera rostochiensis TaxID=31243 RepID=A0A914H066_GLORO